MSGGWTVRVTMKVDGGGTSVRQFHAACPDRVEAEQAVRKYDQVVTSDVLIEAVSELSEAELRERKLAPGQVAQWI